LRLSHTSQAGAARPRKFPYIAEPKLVALLHTVLERTEAQIVLTSTWRYDPAGLFSAKHWGIPFIDITPDLPKKPRRDEILAWLRVHPGVTRFAVLDDEDDELDGLPLFQPSAVLTEEMAQGLMDYLARNTDRDMRSSRLSRIFQNLHAILTGHKG
jgi:HAD domain in Swiss Army Knife RNA repair proteins